MRALSAFALAAAFAFVPFATSEDKKELKRPPLDAKEWKKQKSGLEIWDVTEGKGDEAKAGAVVTIHYTGWLTDDEQTKFDSSVDRGKQATFPLGNLIKGWQEGIPGMKVGGVRRLKIPSDLAYGDNGRGKIPGKATLVFEIELFAVKNLPSRPDLTAKEWKKEKSGLEIWDVKEGKGDPATIDSEVTVHYTGWLTDEKAKKFDSSLDSGKPITFPLKGVIKGWQEGIPGMKPGGVRRLKIPADLAYGKDGAGDDIPPNATLVFEVELIEVK